MRMSSTSSRTGPSRAAIASPVRGPGSLANVVVVGNHCSGGISLPGIANATVSGNR